MRLDRHKKVVVWEMDLDDLWFLERITPWKDEMRKEIHEMIKQLEDCVKTETII